MKPTAEFVQKQFDEWNARCFENSLPPIPIQLSKSRSMLGAIVSQRHRTFTGEIQHEVKCMRISLHFDLSESIIVDTIIHEMIHYYIFYHHLHDTSAHGVLFRKMMLLINDHYHRHITVSTRLKEADKEQAHLRERKRLHVVCISELNEGRVGVTVCAKTRVGELNRLLPKYYTLTSLKWYITVDTFFNRFPLSRTPKIYLITPEELAQCELTPLNLQNK